MENPSNLHVECRKARYAEFVQTLCSIVAELIESQLEGQTCLQCTSSLQEVSAVDDGRSLAGEDLSLSMMLETYRLTPRQVLMLRRRAGFPTPYRKHRKLMFRHSEVEQWLALQPNRARPADVLKRRKGDPIRRITPQRGTVVSSLSNDYKTICSMN